MGGDASRQNQTWTMMWTVMKTGRRSQRESPFQYVSTLVLPLDFGVRAAEFHCNIAISWHALSAHLPIELLELLPAGMLMLLRAKLADYERNQL